VNVSKYSLHQSFVVKFNPNCGREEGAYRNSIAATPTRSGITVALRTSGSVALFATIMGVVSKVRTLTANGSMSSPRSHSKNNWSDEVVMMVQQHAKKTHGKDVSRNDVLSMAKPA
jgi:hypothetical protein